MDKSEQMRIIGNNLRRCRQLCGLTQSALAEKVGLETSSYTNLENGKKGASLILLRRLADALGVSMDCLVYADNDNDRPGRNIEIMLQGKPKSYVRSIEKLIRVCLEEFSAGSNADDE